MRKILAILAGIFGLTSAHASAQGFVAYQDTKSLLQKLENGKMPYNFFGLTSNGIDCLYFAYENGKFILEYEVMVEPQKKVASNFISWAKKSGFDVIATTYGNQPEYQSSSPAPVYRIILDKAVDSAYTEGLSFFSDVFD